MLLLLVAPVPRGYAATPDISVLASESREAADLLSARFRELSQSLVGTEVLRAIAVRRYSMPAIASDVSRKTGWKVAAVSLRPRNPALGTPDAWERAVLMQFEAKNRRGEKPEQLQHYEIVTEGSSRYFRYMKGIVLSQPCLTCHGNGIAPEVKAQLAKDYPHDRSTGYQVGEVRGAVSVKRPL
jgi:hypothetical protein